MLAHFNFARRGTMGGVTTPNGLMKLLEFYQAAISIG